MNQLNHKTVREETKTSRPSSLNLDQGPQSLENIKDILKDSPSLKQALLNIATSPSGDLGSLTPGELNLSQILSSLIASSSPQMTNSTLTAFPGIGNKAGHLLPGSLASQLMIQPNEVANNNSGLTYHTILNLCQQQQNQALKGPNLLEQGLLSSAGLFHPQQNASQPQLILLAQSGVHPTVSTQNGQSFPTNQSSTNNQTSSLNLVKKETVDPPSVDSTNQDLSDGKRRLARRENNDESGISFKSRRKSPSRLEVSADSSGCLSPSGKTNYSLSPKGADSNSSCNNFVINSNPVATTTFTTSSSADPFEKSRLMRLEKKRARNRDAAKKCRERKLTLIRSLEVHVAQLAEDNRSLKARLVKSKAEVDRLKNFVVEHLDKDCEFMSKVNSMTNDLPPFPTSA